MTCNKQVVKSQPMFKKFGSTGSNVDKAQLEEAKKQARALSLLLLGKAA